jgi:hypothetical protein
MEVISEIFSNFPTYDCRIYFDGIEEDIEDLISGQMENNLSIKAADIGLVESRIWYFISSPLPRFIKIQYVLSKYQEDLLLVRWLAGLECRGATTAIVG